MHSSCVVCPITNLQSYRGWGGGQGYEGFMKNRLGQNTVYLKCVAYTAFLYLSEVHLAVLSHTEMVDQASILLFNVRTAVSLGMSWGNGTWLAGARLGWCDSWFAGL